MTTAKKLNGQEKAAILLLAVGEDMASEILKNLDVREIHKIGNYMNRVTAVGREEFETVAREFEQGVREGGVLPAGSEEYIKKILHKALGQEKATWVMEHLKGGTDEGGVESLKWLDPRVISNFLRIEHPQTIALILASLDPDQAGEVLQLLPEALRADVAMRIAGLESVPPGVIKDLDDVLREKLLAGGAAQANFIGGVEVVAEMLNQMDRTKESAIMSRIEEHDPDLAERIRQLMFVFDDLVNVDDRGMQQILKEISSEDLVLALRTAGEGIKEKIFHNMSERAAQILREDMEARGPVKLSDVERAQQAVVKIARKLEEEGKIVIGGRGGEELVV